MNVARWIGAGIIAVAAIGMVASATAQTPIEATTPAGERILLYPDGRWEYADPAKRAATPRPAPPAVAAPAATATATPAATATATPAAARTAAGACPPEAQGHVLWIGRCVLPGDADYNRGSLSGKGR